MLRLGVGPIAAGAAAFATGFILFLSLTIDRAPANTGSRVTRAFSVFGAVDPVAKSQTSFSARWQSLEAEDAPAVVSNDRDDRRELWSAQSSFGDRFLFEQPDTPTGSFQRSASFDDRFPGQFVAYGGSSRSAGSTQRVAAETVTPRAIARSALAPLPPKRPPQPRFQLASASATSLPLAYAPADSVKTSAIPGSALKELTPKASKPLDPGRTAVYDITAQTVYLPSGRRLEAHSGLGSYMDDPRYVHIRMNGSTPPNVYDLKLREAPFHGVRAIRLIPADSSKMYGRAGILAHSYLLGPSGASNGCVSFSDYGAFLEAFERGEIDRLVVVERLDNPPPPRTASDWFRDFFRRS